MPRLRRTRPATVQAVTSMSAAAARQVRERGRRATRRVAVLLPLVIGVLLVYRYRIELFKADESVRVICALALVALGWWFARDVGRAASPMLFKRLDQPTAGTVSFL